MGERFTDKQFWWVWFADKGNVDDGRWLIHEMILLMGVFTWINEAGERAFTFQGTIDLVYKFSQRWN